MDDLQRYYDRRAAVYEDIYRRDDPVRQAELKMVEEYARAKLAGRRVLEIACGTGFWSRKIVHVARHITAIDSSREMLAIARGKTDPPAKIDFRLADAFALDDVPGRFDGALAIFWLSHVPKSRIALFLEGLRRRVDRGASIVMADNMFNDGLGGEIVRPEGSEDAFKIRELPDGSRYRIVKNYYRSADLHALFHSGTIDLDVHIGTCYWWLSYRIQDPGRGPDG
jgi:SAM-dependent methyltransferase